MIPEITDTDRLNFLIENSGTWVNRQGSFGGFWDDGVAPGGGTCDPITPDAEDGDPRTALDLAIIAKRQKEVFN